MSADELLHTIKLSAQQGVGQIRGVLYGHISVYDPGEHRVKCIIPSMTGSGGNPVQTPWMPLGSIWVGDGWGIQMAPKGGANFANPTDGERVRILIFDRNYGAAAVAEFDFTQKQLPPDQTLKAGEFLAMHESGSFLKFTKDGDVEITAARDLVMAAGRHATLQAAAGIMRVAGEVVELHGSTTLRFDAFGCGVDYTFAGGTDYTITSYTLGISPTVVVPNPPEIE